MNTSSATDDLDYIFGRTRGYLLTEQTAHEAVNALAEVARDVVDHAQGAGVSLISSDGQRLSVGATNEAVREADNLQYDLQEGPCLRAWATREVVVVTDSRTDDRWRRWAMEAAASGILSCISVPLVKGPTAIGAMKIYADTANAFTLGDQHMLTHLAKSAAALLGHIQASDMPRRINEDVKESLRNRDAVGIARGILMERHRLDKHAALNQLVTLATELNTTIRSMAFTIINSPDATDFSGSQ